MEITSERSDIMTDLQFKSILKMVRSIVKNASSIEEILKELNDILGEDRDDEMDKQ